MLGHFVRELSIVDTSNKPIKVVDCLLRSLWIVFGLVFSRLVLP